MNLKGLKGGKYRVLKTVDIERIHSFSLQVLEKIGVKVESEEFLTLFAKAGAKASKKNKVVTLSKEMVEEALEKVPSRVVLYGRDEKHTLDLSDNRVYLGTGGAAVNIIDLEVGRVRSPTLNDLSNLARLVDYLENIHFFLRPVVATDISKEILDVNKYYVALANTAKHVMASCYSATSVDDICKMASIIAGGEDELHQKPFISFITSWMVSPLKLDVGTTKVLKKVIEHEIPVALSTAPAAGSTAPATLAGTLVQVHAEELFGIVLTQILKEGAPILYGPVPACANMQNMAYLGGAIESGLLNAACVQMAKHIHVPIYTDAGLTDSKLSDIQAGYEKAFNILQVALAGGNYIHHGAGMLESMLTVSFEQFVIDNDICGMALRALKGIEVDEDRLAFDIIEKVGPGGNYLTQPHTVKYARSDEYFLPKVADRKGRSTWEKTGAKDTREKAKEKVKEILEEHHPKPIPENLDRKIKEKFEIVDV